MSAAQTVDDGGPVSVRVGNIEHGMSLRDYTALEAMRSLIAISPIPSMELVERWCESIAAVSHKIADSMMQERQRRAAGAAA